MPDFAVPQNELPDIVHECGRIQSLYYAATEIYHIGREDFGLGPDKQAARVAMSRVAAQLVDNALNKHIQRLARMLHNLDITPEPEPSPAGLDAGDGTEKETV